MTTLTVPAGDLELPEGRGRLAYAGAITINDGALTQGRGGAWRGPHGLGVIATIDETETWGPLLHVSLSYPDRLPSWGVVKAVREAFFPDDVDAMMMLPRSADYVNVHEFTLHVVQCPERWGMR